MKIGICDDQAFDRAQARSVIEDYLTSKNIDYDVFEYDNLQVLLGETIPLDVLFMDIELQQGINGIEGAKRVHDSWHDCKIVFITRNINYASDVYTTDHVFFVIKDQLSRYIDSLFTKIFALIEQEQPSITFKMAHNHVVRLKPDDIVYIERQERKSHINTANHVYAVRDKITELYEQLKMHDFIRTHNSYIVSVKMITAIYNDHLVLNNVLTIPISRRYRQTVREQFLAWIDRNPR
ncbi:MAG: LytR/AlgR family response regulator transcription factor [bacterium]